MIPDIDTFRKAVEMYRGNLSAVARAFGVTRTTLDNWKNTNDEYRQVVSDARMKLFDECLISAESVAKGIPAYATEVDPETGRERRVVVGWAERPDGQMLRYLLGMLGKNEGFGDTPETATDKPINGTGNLTPPPVKVEIVYTDKKDLELQDGKPSDFRAPDAVEQATEQ